MSSSSSSQNKKRPAPSAASQFSTRTTPDGQRPPRVRLLLHAPDGVFPYLTPQMVQRCFPSPHDTKETPTTATKDRASPTTDVDNDDDIRSLTRLLWLGIAVRDTCVVPVYPSDNSDNNKKKDKDTDKTSQKHCKPRDKDKPLGYTFSGITKTSTNDTSTMLPHGTTLRGSVLDPTRQYPYVVVPSFDLWKDLPVNYGTNGISVTDQHVQMWTPNGRLSLTPQLYHQVCQDLASHHHEQQQLSSSKQPFRVISLYDMIPKCSNDNRKAHAKRSTTAIRRTHEWFQQYYQQTIADESNSVQWFPLVVNQWGEVPGTQWEQVQSVPSRHSDATDPNTADTPKSDHSLIQGVVLHGWGQIDESDHRKRLVETVQQHCHDSIRSRLNLGPTLPEVVVLSTPTLSHLIDAITFAKDSHNDQEGTARRDCQVLIGSDLPTAWAHQHKAFLLDADIWRHRLGQTGASLSDVSNVASKRSRVADQDVVYDDDGCFVLDQTSRKDCDVTSHPWYCDKQPMLQGCSCMACVTHSRAYVYHLVCAKELLGEILLFVHNLHHLLCLLREANVLLNYEADADKRKRSFETEASFSSKDFQETSI